MGFVKDAWNGITGKTSAKAAEKSGNIQADASTYAADLSAMQYAQTRQDQMPWLNAGANALSQLQNYTQNNAKYSDQYGNAVNQALGGIGGNVSAGNPYRGAYDAQLNNMLGSINPNGNITAQNVMAQSIKPQSITHQDIVSNDIKSGNIVSNDIKSGNIVSNDIKSGNIVSSDVKSRDIATNNKFNVGNFSDKMQGTIDRNYNAGKYTGGLSLDDFEVDPGYEFRKQQGMDGIQSSAAASGGLLSGAALKALNQHNSNLASQEYNNAWQRNQLQKQQQYGVDTGLLGQNYNMFADQQNRKLNADITGATMNQQAAMYNTSNDLNAQLANQSNRFNTQATNIANSLAAQSANQTNRFNTQATNIANDIAVQSANQASRFNTQATNIANSLAAQSANQDNRFRVQSANQNSRFNTQATNVANNMSAQAQNTSNDLNAQMTNVNNSMAAQSANQNYGLSALQSLMAAKGQDYGIYSDQQDRNMQAQQFNIGNQYNALNALMNARSQDYNMFNNEDARLFNQLANLAGVGQQTATNLGSFGAANASTIGDAYINAANARANGLVGGANAKASGWGNLLNLGMMAGGFI